MFVVVDYISLENVQINWGKISLSTKCCMHVCSHESCDNFELDLRLAKKYWHTNMAAYLCIILYRPIKSNKLTCQIL
jgi:hypothetical protein